MKYLNFSVVIEEDKNGFLHFARNCKVAIRKVKIMKKPW